MGSFKFCVYALPISAIIKAHGLNYHIYADDTQVYVTFDIPEHVLNKLNACLSDIRLWMIANKLKINDENNEFLATGSPLFHSKMTKSHELSTGNSKIKASQLARN